MALGGGSPAGREIQHQLPSCQEEPSAPTPTFPLQEGSGSARRGRRGKPGRAGKEAGFLSPLAVFSEVWLEAECLRSGQAYPSFIFQVPRPRARVLL